MIDNWLNIKVYLWNIFEQKKQETETLTKLNLFSNYLSSTFYKLHYLCINQCMSVLENSFHLPWTFLRTEAEDIQHVISVYSRPCDIHPPIRCWLLVDCWFNHTKRGNRFYLAYAKNKQQNVMHECGGKMPS